MTARRSQMPAKKSRGSGRFHREGYPWTKTATSNVPAVQSAGMTYDASAADGYVVLFGGTTTQSEQATTGAFT